MTLAARRRVCAVTETNISNVAARIDSRQDVSPRHPTPPTGRILTGAF